MLQFSCEKSILSAALNIASRTVAAKSPISVLEGIYVRAGVKLELTGYNLETGITVSVPAEIREQGECVMAAKLFCDMIRKLPDEIVTVSVDDALKVSVKCGISSFFISAENAEDYPELPEVETENGIAIPQRELREMLGGTIFSASEEAVRPIHTGCLFEVEPDSVTVIAVDGFRLALRRYRPEQSLDRTMKFVVPAAALREVERILEDTDDNAIVTLGRKHITFTMGDSTLVCRILEGEFMNWRKVMDVKDPMKLTAKVSTLAASIDRVSLMVNEKFKSPVRCQFGGDGAQFRTETAIGTANDFCPMVGDGKELEIGFNCRFLADALRQIPTEEVTLELTDQLNPLIMTPPDGRDHFAYLVLPVRMRSGE